MSAVSVADDRARLGRPVGSWEPWVWELTSLAAYLLLAPAIMRLSQWLRPPRVPWPAVVAAHLLLSVPASAFHVALMTAFRYAAYALLGESYSPGSSPGAVLVYEYRKDLMAYAALVLLPFLAERQLRGSRRPSADSPRYIEVRDGGRRLRLAPADIEWAQAAGNYVELHGPFGSALHRQTLAALEEDLNQHDFARIHRSRIVRTDTVTAVETNPSGDFEVTLASGAKVLGSRRFRRNLDLKPSG